MLMVRVATKLASMIKMWLNDKGCTATAYDDHVWVYNPAMYVAKFVVLNETTVVLIGLSSTHEFDIADPLFFDKVEKSLTGILW